MQADQTIIQTNLLANSLFVKAAFPSAIKEYKRYIFFTPDSVHDKAFFRIGRCYQELNEFETASNYFDRSFFASNDHQIKIESMFQKAGCLINLNRYSDALFELLQVSNKNNEATIKRKHFYLGLIYYKLEKWDSSQTYLTNYIEMCGSEDQKDNIRKIFDEVKKINPNKPKIARIFSYIIPGLGQAYSGDVKNALNSLTINGIFGYLYVYVAATYGFVDAFIAVFPFLYRYYLGGIYHADRIAFEKNNKKIDKCYLKILESLKGTVN
ncbi:tetratricopeptide repeat protein [Bacteroidales bacterium AH-315-N07]|nr:tetratricopeptide repeat protein [Bacteroidales bacterium AH-315-N07]